MQNYMGIKMPTQQRGDKEKEKSIEETKSQQEWIELRYEWM